MQPSVDDVKYSNSVQVVLVLTGLDDSAVAGKVTKLESSSAARGLVNMFYVQSRMSSTARLDSRQVDCDSSNDNNKEPLHDKNECCLWLHVRRPMDRTQGMHGSRPGEYTNETPEDPTNNYWILRMSYICKKRKEGCKTPRSPDEAAVLMIGSAAPKQTCADECLEVGNTYSDSRNIDLWSSDTLECWGLSQPHHRPYYWPLALCR